MYATESETEISVSIGLDVTAEAPQKIKVDSGIGFLDHVSWHKRTISDRILREKAPSCADFWKDS